MSRSNNFNSDFFNGTGEMDRRISTKSAAHMKSDIFHQGEINAAKEAPINKGKREAIQSHRDNDIFGVRERTTGVKQPYQEHDIVAARKAD
ncbi:Oidioi.mRNA.OKI2018_I69.chr1.g1623.t1.cds [Oikopleura dioica]|uniref:Oidioi.mRNA.OKI2018_I69.chr1.g1623.t1.cds n=1 Tax=Oikopleura dioica TaxID=34765 RepID=A0ABN7SSB5_OIKDI|nr:Oidioi.mRNA.OKI2018_I69.chr1.g1623.t1.cds [Oikopleura dioica]